MKLLFTRLQEENSIAKRSITQIQLETGGHAKKSCFSRRESRLEPGVIREVKPEAAVEIGLEKFGSRPALTASGEHVPDPLDQCSSGNGYALTSITPSSVPITTTSISPLQRVAVDRTGFVQPHDNLDGDPDAVFRVPCDCECLSLLDTEEQRARYQFVARKFVAVQNIVQHFTQRDKSGSFEMTI